MRKLALLLVALSAFLVPTQAFASFPGSPGVLAFTEAAADGRRVIAIGNADLITGQISNQVLIDRGPGLDATQPTWAADGTTLAFVSPGGLGRPLQIWKADGVSGPRRLTHGRRDSIDPAWSPDGGSIAFARMTSTGRYRVLVLAIGTGVLTRVSTDLATAREPAWSAGGELVVAGRTLIGSAGVCGSACLWELYTVDPTGITAPTQLTSVNFSVREPDWSPDDSQLVVSARAGGQPVGIQTFAADGSVEDFYSPGSSSSYYTDPVWSPSQPANDPLFALTYVSSGTPAVVVFDAHQGLIAADSTSAWAPSWQPGPA